MSKEATCGVTKISWEVSKKRSAKGSTKEKERNETNFKGSTRPKAPSCRPEEERQARAEARRGGTKEEYQANTESRGALSEDKASRRPPSRGSKVHQEYDYTRRAEEQRRRAEEERELYNNKMSTRATTQ